MGGGLECGYSDSFVYMYSDEPFVKHWLEGVFKWKTNRVEVNLYLLSTSNHDPLT